MRYFWEVLMHSRFNKVSGFNKVSADEVTQGVEELLKAHSTHMCTSCFISPDLLRAFLTPPYNISMLQWIRESADLVRLPSLICDERGRVGPHRAAREPCGQVVLLLHPPSQL